MFCPHTTCGIQAFQDGQPFSVDLPFLDGVLPDITLPRHCSVCKTLFRVGVVTYRPAFYAVHIQPSVSTACPITVHDMHCDKAELLHGVHPGREENFRRFIQGSRACPLLKAWDKLRTTQSVSPRRKEQ